MNVDFFAILFEDVRHERLLIFLLPLTDEGIMKQTGFLYNQRNWVKVFALETLHEQKALKEHVALQLIDYYFPHI